MSIDRRLHHAARELRELPISPPPLGARRPSPRGWVVAVPAVALVVGLSAATALELTGGAGADVYDDSAAATVPVTVEVVEVRAALPTGMEEVQLIESIAVEPVLDVTPASVDTGLPGNLE